MSPRLSKQIVFAAALLTFLVIGRGPLSATVYHIGSGQPADDTHFDTLQSLYTAHSSLSNDTIIFYKDDDSWTSRNSFQVSGSLEIRSDVAGEKRIISGQNVGGRIFDYNSATVTISNDFIIEKVNSSASGTMALYGSAVLNIEGVTYRNNMSSSFGGAIDTYGGNSQWINARGAQFEDNRGSRGGGVELYLMKGGDFTNANFLRNEATNERGGAIIVLLSSSVPAEVILGATDGMVSTFEGNRFTGGGADLANSLYVTYDGTLNVKIETEGTGILDLIDPIILTEGSNYTATFTKTGLGTWKVGGNTQINTGDGTAAFSIDAGEFYFYTDAEIHMTGANDSFTAKKGATVSINGGNILEGTKVVFNAESTLNFDMDFYHGQGNPLSQSMLYLSGETLEISRTFINVNNLPEGPDGYGTYTLVQGNSALDAGDFVLHINGREVDVSGEISERFGYSLGNTDDVRQLVLRVQALENSILSWQNYEHGGDAGLGDQWSIYGKNWDLMYENPVKIDSYVYGDTVVFDNLDNGEDVHTIMIGETVVIGPNAKPASAADPNFYVDNGIGMHVTGSENWTFQGHSITDASSENPYRAAGLLFSGSGTLTLANAEANTYTGATTLSGGGTLAVSRTDLLGTSDVRFQNNLASTLRFTDSAVFDKTIYVGVGGRGILTVDKGKDLVVTNTDWGSIRLSGGRFALQGNADNPILVTGNHADGDVGGIYVNVGYVDDIEHAATFEASDVIFDRNSSADIGGAIAAYHSNVHVKDSVFTNNTAETKGGAIDFYGSGGKTLLIEASAEKTTSFSGNTAAGEANSIHVRAMDYSTEAVAVEIRTAADGTVDMLDPMSGYAATARTITIDKTGAGTWNLAGRSEFTGAGSGKTLLTVSEGTLSLYKADDSIEAGALDIKGTFTLGADGTLLSNGGNEITATTIRLESGATLAFDMTDIQENSPAFLDMRAETWNSDWSQYIDLKNFVNPPIKDGSTFNYKLVTLNAGDVTVADMTLLYRGTEVNSLRENFGQLKVTEVAAGEKLLSVDISKALNGVTVWNPDENRTWDAAAKNWNGTDLGIDDITGSKQFLHGDAVLFTDDGAGNVRVAAAGVEIVRHNDEYRGLTIDNSGENTYTFSGGPIEGSGGLLKKGDGSAVFTASNTFSGGTTIEDGEVVVQRVDALGAGDVAVAAPGTLRFDMGEGSVGEFSNFIDGAGRVVKSGQGTVKLSGKNAYEGGTDLRTGELILGNVDALGSGAVLIGDRTVLTFGDVVGTGSRPAEFSNIISGAGAVRATGETNLFLSGENTYSGGTNVGNGATVTIRNLSAVGSGNIIIDGTFVVDLDADASIEKRTIGGGGILQKTGAGTLSLLTVNSFNGITQLLEGGLRLVEGDALKNSTLDYSGGTFSFGLNTEVNLGGLAGDRNIALSNDNSQTVQLTIGENASDESFDGVLSGLGGITKVGRGTQIFTRVNSYSGGTVVSDGRLVAVGVGALGTGSVENNSELEFRIRGTASETYDKVIFGSGSLIKSGTGTLALTAENSYEGGTVIDEGTLEIDSLRAVGMHLTPTSDRTGTVTIKDDATLVLNLDEDASAEDEDYTITRNITGAGTFVKDGSGTLVIARELSFTGNIDVASGTLFMNGKTGSAITVRNGGTLAGIGRADNSLLFEKGSSHRVDYSDVSRLGTFTANELKYEGASTVYLKIGRNGSDRIISKGGIDFAAGGGVVNVVLLNLGAVDSGEIEIERSYELFSAEGGILRINGQYVSSGHEGKEFLTLNGVDGILFQADEDQDITILGHSVQSTGNLSKGIYLDVYLTGSGLGGGQTSPDGVASSMTSNQLEVFGGIGDASVYDRILSYQKSARGDVINQLTPMIQTITPYLTQRSVTQFNSALFQRLRFRRQAFLQPAAAFAEEDEMFARGQERRRCLIDGRNDLWFQNYGDFIRMSAEGMRPNFQADTYGFNMGFDRDVHHNVTLGMGFGGYFSEVRANDYGQKGNVDAFLISGYGDWRNDCLVFSASTGLVAAQYSLDRTVSSFDTFLESKHDGTTFFISGELSRKSYWGRCELTPFVGLDLIWMWEDAYREKAKGDSAIALHVKKDYNASILGNAGLRLGRTFRLLGGNVVSPSVYAAWVHDYNKGRIYSTAGFAGEPMFTIAGAKMNRDRAKVGANVDMTINHRMDMFGRFDAEFSNGMNSLTFHWGIQMGF